MRCDMTRDVTRTLTEHAANAVEAAGRRLRRAG